jgi:capsular exopolysaccharide synthesis family protein
MDLRSYIRFLRESWEWIAVFTLIGIVAAMQLSLSEKPKFVATSELFLTTPGYSSMGSLSTTNSSPYQADAFSQQRARSYVQLASRVDVARRVVEKLGLTMRPEDLADATSASVVPDTVLIDVAVKSSSPAEAKVLTDAVTAELANDIRKLETPSGTLVPVVDPVVTQLAETPTRPQIPNIAIYLIFGASGGFLAGVTVVLLLRNRRRVEQPQVERLTNRPMLGAVRFDRVHSEAVADGGPSTSDRFEQQWRLIHRNVAFEMDAASDRVLAVTSVNGSGQSSATAAALASAFARGGLRVLLAVTKPNVHNYVVTRECPPVGLAGVVAGESRLDDAIQPADTENLYYLAGPGPDDVTPLLQSEKFRQLVGQLRNYFDLVIFDSPEFLRLVESTLLSEVVDSVILVMTEKDTDRRDLLEAVRVVGKCHVRLLGSIWNSGTHRRSISAPQPTFVTSRRPSQ